MLIYYPNKQNNFFKNNLKPQTKFSQTISSEIFFFYLFIYENCNLSNQNGKKNEFCDRQIDLCSQKGKKTKLN